MYCPDCGAHHHESLTCQQCGFRLPVSCPGCAQINAADNHFCFNCGQPLSTHQNHAPEPSILSERTERRQLTVMFCDLVGSTELSQNLDPEDLRDIIHAFQQQCTEAIKFFDGYIARYMGDGILAYFGYPNAHELDTERAVRSGLDIIQRTRTIKAGDKKLRVRIGIETGLVVAGDIIGNGEAQEHTVLGDTPNIAARLQGIATPDSVVIGPGTFGVIHRRFNIVQLGLHQLKGLSGPIPAYQITDAAIKEQPQELAAFFGRQQELSSIADCLNRNTSGAVIVIEGGSGLGKSRLLKQVLQESSASHQAVILRCSPFYTDRPLYPVIQHWLALLDLQENDPATLQRKRLYDFLSANSFDNESARELIAATLFQSCQDSIESSRLIKASDAELRRAKLAALTEVIAHLSTLNPMMIAVEDAHWIDSTTAELLNILSQHTNQPSLTLLMTSRVPLLWLPHKHCTPILITLNPLSESAMRELISAVAGQQQIPPATQQEILIKSDGSPLYAEELTKTVLELGADSNRPIQVPSSLHDSLRARLDRLGGAREVAQFVAVIGRSFSHRLIRACTPYSKTSTDKALEVLVAADLLISTGSGERKGFAFRHMMLQEVAYNSLLNKTRRDHHQRIAEAIKQHFPDMIESSPEVLASHFERANQFDDALHYWQLAGEHAAASWAHAEAVNHLRRALQLLESSDRSTQQSTLELALRISLVKSLRILEQGDEALQQLEVAEALARQLDRLAELAIIHNLHGNILFSKGDLAGCMSNHHAAIDCARTANSPVEEIQAISGLGDANLLKGHIITAEQSYQKCLRLCQTPRLQRFVPPNLALQGHMRLYLNQLAASEQDIVEAIKLAQAAGDHRTEMIAMGSCLAKTLCEKGQYLRAQEALTAALEIARELNALRFEALYLLFLVRVIYFLDRDGDGQDLNVGRQLADQAIKIAQQTDFRYVGAIAFGAKALIISSPLERQGVLQEGQKLLLPGAPSQNYLWFLRDAIEVSLLDKNWPQAAIFAEQLKTYTRQQPLPWSDIYIRVADCFQQPHSGSPSAKSSSSEEELRAHCHQTGLKAVSQLLGRLTAAT